MDAFRVACIVDDDPIFVMVIKKMIEITQFSDEVVVYGNGSEALDALHHASATDLPDVILLDLNMPIANGWDFLDNFSQGTLAGKIPVYIVTSSIDPRDRERAASYAVVRDFLVKPIRMPQLRAILGATTDGNEGKMTG